jgi:hypothetical protein
VLEYPLHPTRKNATRINMNEPEIGVLAMNIVLDTKLSSRAEKWAIRWRGCNKSSEFISMRHTEKSLKFASGENCMFILDSSLSNCT